MALQETESSTTSNSTNSSHVVRNSLLAGSAAGITSTLACHPFDVLRTKMQAASMTTASTATAPATGLRHVISQTLHHGGFRALYTGLALPLAAQAVYKATIFTVNNVTQQALLNRKSSSNDNKASLTLMDHFMGGFVAGGVNAALFVTPVEYVRNQMIRHHSLQAQAAVGGVPGQPLQTTFLATAHGPWQVIRATMQRSSILGLWKGVMVTVARDAIGVAFFFAGMQGSLDYFAHYQQQQQSNTNTITTIPPKPTLGMTMVAGSLAGLGYWIVALPLDSIKTWVQSDMADSAWLALKNSLQQHGWKETGVKLLAGYPVAYGRGIPSAAITVATYSLCYSALSSP